MLDTSSDVKRTKSIFTMSQTENITLKSFRLKDFNVMFSVGDMKRLRAKCNIAINNCARAEDLTVKAVLISNQLKAGDRLCL